MNVDDYKPRAIRIIETAIGDMRDRQGDKLAPEQLFRSKVHPNYNGIRSLAVYRLFANGCPVWILKALFDMKTDRALNQALGSGVRLDRGEK